MDKQQSHSWHFDRLGGFDQVRIASGADLEHLASLDQKLWASLSSPVSGLEFDAHTLALLDSDRDGRIRPPEIIAAARLVCDSLRDPGEIFTAADALTLSSLDEHKPLGKRLLQTARQVLTALGKADAAGITPAEVADTAHIFAGSRFNGDGIVPAEAAEDAAGAAAITDMITCIGSKPDRGGSPGIDAELLQAFSEEAAGFLAWWAEAEAAGNGILPLGDATTTAAAALEAVRAKIEDYFARTALAAFDGRAATPLNPAEADYAALAPKSLTGQCPELAAFPLAHVAADQPLPLASGLNPAWSAAISTFRIQVVTPLLGERDRLNRADWQQLNERFAAYFDWLGRKQGARVEALGVARVRELAASTMQQQIQGLLELDQQKQAVADTLDDLEKLVHLRVHLAELLRNFVSLHDFYHPERNAVFQAGILYLDGRSCELCIKVEDVARHSALAVNAKTYLAYCDCRRRSDNATMQIAAAFTAGDAVNLMVGRNGVFYDRKGADWDATIVKLIEHPISIAQAFWSPYRRVGRMIQEQIEKFAGERDKAVDIGASGLIADTSKQAAEGKAAAAFDIGKFAGIFAAIGLAVGAIGTAIASVVSGLLALSWWEVPLAVAGLLLVISGPAMVMAWLKLRQRNLGPLLDANGWAVNTQASINTAFGGTLTQVGELPPGSDRSFQDPFAEKRRPWKLYLFLLILAVAAGIGWQRGWIQQGWHKFQQRAQQTIEQPAPPAAETKQ